MKAYKLLIFLLVGILAAMGLDFGAMYMHENAHKAIFNNHGCPDTSININLLGGFTRCNEMTNVTEETRLQMKALHNLNEIVGYNTQVLIGALVVSSLLIGTAIIIK